jgi:indolepyruvate ferredoxin oxidoreductase, beta subunit
MTKPVNIVIAGLGGQGVIKASDILSDVAFRAGLDIKKAEVHGMSQRGGSVSTDVRYGPRVLSPMVPPGEADFLLVLEETQTDPNRFVLRPGGTVLAPSLLDPTRLPSPKTLNVAMLGVLSAFLDFSEEAWLSTLRQALPASLLDMNLAAFAVGREAGRLLRTKQPPLSAMGGQA